MDSEEQQEMPVQPLEIFLGSSFNAMVELAGHHRIFLPTLSTQVIQMNLDHEKHRLVSLRIDEISVKSRIALVTLLLIPSSLLWANLFTVGTAPDATATGFLLAYLLAVSTITDLWFRKIYNCVTIPLFVAAIGMNLCASLTGTGAFSLGTVGIGQSLGGAVLCFAIVFAAYLKSGCGAGDVKIAAVIGAMLGVQLGVWAVLYSYIAAFVFCIARFGLLKTLTDRKPVDGDANRKPSAIAMAPFFALGTLFVIWERTL